MKDPQQRGAGPSGVTPISLVTRDDLDWLVTAYGTDRGEARPETGPLADVLEALGDRGSQFTTDLVGITRRMPGEIAEALWEGVARGLIMGDGFDAIRVRVAPGGDHIAA